MITPDMILSELLQTGQMTLEEYLKAQELPSETINNIRKAIEEYETDRR